MAKIFPEISDKLRAWIEEQPMFFVATAPLSGDGFVNCSPKGLDTLRILDSETLAYLDLTGSGAETIAHIQENQRMVMMWCAFWGPPRIARVHGKGEVIYPDSPKWEEYSKHFEAIPGARAIIVLRGERISDSCGYGVPEFELKEQRETLVKWAERKGPDGIEAYNREKNTESIDGLAAMGGGES
ncbi:MAG: pyridoxamine 5'-phosphate oxidase family protein [Opitutales bacterium]|nr:pyridoxamine 5'-phosphate oxidase family protein [Opitutales bacterium]NRA26645.1 pyridoxamine 5'-phosphate oxidase family protein [Opitutales bacterium]